MSGTPSPLLQIVHVRNLSQKIGGNLPYEMGLGTCFFFFGTRVFRPAGRETVFLSIDAEVEREATRFV